MTPPASPKKAFHIASSTTDPLAPSSQVALVTGASGGIGRACATTLAAQGFAVAIHYNRSKDLALELATQCAESQIFQADLSSPDGPAKLIRDVARTMGPIRVLVNNAGMTIDKLTLMSSIEQYEAIFNTNLRATYQLSKAVLKPMIKHQGGRIINITSIIGHTGARGQSLYSSSKAAITALTQSLAAETGRFNILCNCVAPGYIATAMTESIAAPIQEKIMARIHLGRPGTPAEVAAAVGFLASDHAAYITGTTLHVNGGMAGF